MLVLGACSTSPHGRTQITTPSAVSAAYSEMDLQLHLATSTSISAPCDAEQCNLNQQFDWRVQDLGARLDAAAFDVYPELAARIDRFDFAVAEKQNPGSTSTASGKIVLFRGVQALEPDDEMLAFLIAQEMGHVIGKHHDENTATRILFSVLVGALFPAAGLFSESAAAAQATSMTTSATVATAAASTATSLVGSHVVLASVRPGQLSEADAIALNLASRLGWSGWDIARALESTVLPDETNAWLRDLAKSGDNVRLLSESIPVAQDETRYVAAIENIESFIPPPDGPKVEPVETAAIGSSDIIDSDIASAPDQAAPTTTLVSAPTIQEQPDDASSHPEKPVLTAYLAAPATALADTVKNVSSVRHAQSRIAKSTKATAKSSSQKLKSGTMRARNSAKSKMVSNTAGPSHKRHQPRRGYLASKGPRNPPQGHDMQRQPFSAQAGTHGVIKNTPKAAKLQNRTRENL